MWEDSNNSSVDFNTLRLKKTLCPSLMGLKTKELVCAEEAYIA